MLKPYFYKDTIEVGIDEAGRGPLFGRVYVGAAILPPGDEFNHSLMKDSKKFGKSKISFYKSSPRSLGICFLWLSI